MQYSQENSCVGVSFFIKLIFFFFFSVSVFIKKETPTQTFCFEYCEIFKTAFSIENLRWLLLSLLEIVSTIFCILIVHVLIVHQLRSAVLESLVTPPGILQTADFVKCTYCHRYLVTSFKFVSSLCKKIANVNRYLPLHLSFDRFSILLSENY